MAITEMDPHGDGEHTRVMFTNIREVDAWLRAVLEPFEDEHDLAGMVEALVDDLPVRHPEDPRFVIEGSHEEFWTIAEAHALPSSE